MQRLVPALFLLFVAVAGETRAADDKPFRFPAAKHKGAELKYINGLPVLIVSGSPEEIGEAVGKLALKPAPKVLGYPRDLLKALKIDWSWKLFLGNGKAMFKQFPAAYAKELEAIVKGSGGERDLVIAGNTFFDIKKVVACSAVLVDKTRAKNGSPILARNLDYPSLGYIHEYSLVTIYRPKGKFAFATVGFPGLVGVLSGMNEHGLALGVLEVFDVKSGKTHYNAKGIPYGLNLRTLLEECKTIDEAKKKLEKLARTTTINVAIADKKSVGVLEVTPPAAQASPQTIDIHQQVSHITLPDGDVLPGHGLKTAEAHAPVVGWTRT